MVGVDFRNEQRDVGVHPVIARVADDDVAGLRKGALDLAGDRRVEAGEHQRRRAPRRRGVDAHPRDLVGERSRQTPRGGVAIRLSGGSLAGAEPCDFEPWMVREQRDELLTDHAGRSENSHFDRHRHSSLMPLKV